MIEEPEDRREEHETAPEGCAWQAFAEALPIGLSITDAVGRVVSANPRHALLAASVEARANPALGFPQPRL